MSEIEELFAIEGLRERARWARVDHEIAERNRLLAGAEKCADEILGAGTFATRTSEDVNPSKCTVIFEIDGLKFQADESLIKTSTDSRASNANIAGIHEELVWGLGIYWRSGWAPISSLADVGKVVEHMEQQAVPIKPTGEEVERYSRGRLSGKGEE